MRKAVYYNKSLYFYWSELLVDHSEKRNLSASKNPSSSFVHRQFRL